MRFASILFVLATAAAAIAPTACNPNGPGPVVVNSVIDCTGSNAGAVATLFADFKSKLTGGSSWAQIEADAKTAGMAVGGCALALLVQDYLGGKGAPATGDSNAARQALEDFRAHVAGGASFKTTQGSL